MSDPSTTDPGTEPATEPEPVDPGEGNPPTDPAEPPEEERKRREREGVKDDDGETD